MGKKSLVINIEPNVIKMLEFTNKKNKKIIYNCKVIEIPTNVDDREEYIKLRIKETMKENRWTSHRIILNYYDSALLIRGMNLPKIPKDEIEPVLRREVKKYYGELVDKKIIYEIIGEEIVDDREEYSVFYVMLNKEYLDRIENLDLKIETLDFDVFAIDRNFQETLQDEKNTLIVDFGYENLKLYIYRGNTLNIYREVNIGGDEITKTIANFLQVPYEEAEKLKCEYGYISKEKTEELLEYGEKRGMYLNIAYQSVMDKILRKLVHSIDYFKNQNHGIGVNKVYLCGGGAKLKNFQDLLKEELAIDNVETYSGAENFEYKEVPEDFFTDILHYSNLFGTINLDKVIYKPKKVKKKTVDKKNNKIKKYYYIATAFVLLMPLAFLYYSTHTQNEKIKQENKNYRNEIAELEKFSLEYEEKVNELENLKEEKAQLEIISNIDNEITDIMYELSYITDDSIYFDKVNFENKKLKLEGLAFSEDGFPERYINEFVKRAEEKYEEVNIRSLQKKESNKQARFIVEITPGGENNGR